MIDRIGTVLCSCGGCCFASYPCDKCLKNTLKANGIPISEIEQFKGLSQKPVDSSELGIAMSARVNVMEVQMEI